jgi:hypothetical protein
MVLETAVRAPAPLDPMDARVAIVPVEQVLAARVGGADAREKFGEFGVGYRTPLDAERLDRHAMHRPLVQKAVLAAHGKVAAGKPHHVVGQGGADGDPQEERQRCVRGHGNPPEVHDRKRHRRNIAKKRFGVTTPLRAQPLRTHAENRGLGSWQTAFLEFLAASAPTGIVAADAAPGIVRGFSRAPREPLGCGARLCEPNGRIVFPKPLQRGQHVLDTAEMLGRKSFAILGALDGRGQLSPIARLRCRATIRNRICPLNCCKKGTLMKEPASRGKALWL